MTGINWIVTRQKEAEIRIETSLGSTAVYVYENRFFDGASVGYQFSRKRIAMGRNARTSCLPENGESAGSVVVDLDYHLAPEYPYPAAAKRIPKWFVGVGNEERLGFGSGKIVLIGHGVEGIWQGVSIMQLGESGLFLPAWFGLSTAGSTRTWQGERTN